MIGPMAKRTKKKISFGCLFWTLFILLIAALFFLNKDTISFVLNKTNAKAVFLKNKKDNTEGASKNIPEIQLKNEDDTHVSGDGSKETQRNTEALQSMLEQPAQATGEQKGDQGKNGEETGSSQNSNEADAPQPEETVSAAMPQDRQREASIPKPLGDFAARQSAVDVQAKPESGKNQPVVTRKAVIYWIRVDADGKLSPQTVVRLLPKSDSPMSDALKALFNAPVADELKQGLKTLIPPGTKLRSAWVKDTVAFINVSEEFQFNQYGIDGALAQLSQVVFTATEFSTVKSVQFLIEGQKKDYLGAEGVWIGSPLSRTSF